MATATNTQGIIAKQQTAIQTGEKKKTTMKDYIKIMEGAIKKALPTVLTPERFSRMVLSALSSTPALNDCTPASFLGAMMAAAQLGLEPNTTLGQAYLIPYRNHGTLECQFQLGYKGLIDLAYRSGEVSSIQAHEVYANDFFEYELGLDPKLKHIPAKSDRGAVTWYYAVFKTKDGGYGFEVMSVEDVRAHAQRYSKSYSSSASPWKTNFDEMAKKTVLKKALKYAPLKSDFVKQTVADNSIIKAEKDEAGDMVDLQPMQVEYEVDEDNSADEVIDEVIDMETGEVTPRN